MRALLLLLSLAGLSRAQICPPAEVLHPCTCTEQFRKINCIDISGSFDLKGILDNASSFVNDDVVFNSLVISQTPLTEIREGDIEHLKFTMVLITENSQLEYISPNAFNASRNFTTDLYLGDNRLGMEDPNELFQFVRSFPNLSVASLERNNLSSIPENAFQNLPAMVMIVLSFNIISGIGSNAFATGGMALYYVGLYGNSIPSEGLPEDAFRLRRPDWTLFNLAQNAMEFMEERSFRSLLENADNVYVGPEDCDGGSCARFLCDERVNWICDVVEVNPRVLTGYFCKPGDSGADDIFEYCAGRNTTSN